ncbi:hypothetical protein CFP56_013751 [Quercus suber]|uniref:Uncharacterized protein n=1 Tax=Quercus suber TaxID=58331 RepID=A0AAW0KSN0_QUESU
MKHATSNTQDERKPQLKARYDEGPSGLVEEFLMGYEASIAIPQSPSLSEMPRSIPLVLLIKTPGDCVVAPPPLIQIP